MEFNIGDKVRFLNDVGGGEIVKIINNKLVLVRDKDDFEYPFNISDLVLVEKAIQKISIPQTQNKEKNLELKNQKKSTTNKELKKDSLTNIFFAIVRCSSELNDGFDCYLINDSDYTLFYHAMLKADLGFKKIDAENLEPNTKIHIGFLSRDEINSSKEIIIQILFYDHPYNILRSQIERKIKIVPLNFFQEHLFKENDFLDSPAYVFELLSEKLGLGQSTITDDEFLSKIKDIDDVQGDATRRYAPRKERATIEVDLHINELVDSVVGMTNSEILDKQMSVFHQTITNAIMSNAGKVILIHGIGNGTLKATIRESLEKQYKLNFEDASFKDYGFGATKVIL